MKRTLSNAALLGGIALLVWAAFGTSTRWPTGIAAVLFGLMFIVIGVAIQQRLRHDRQEADRARATKALDERLKSPELLGLLQSRLDAFGGLEAGSEDALDEVLQRGDEVFEGYTFYSFAQTFHPGLLTTAQALRRLNEYRKTLEAGAELFSGDIEVMTAADLWTLLENLADYRRNWYQLGSATTKLAEAEFASGDAARERFLLALSHLFELIKSPDAGFAGQKHLRAMDELLEELSQGGSLSDGQSLPGDSVPVLVQADYLRLVATHRRRPSLESFRFLPNVEVLSYELFWTLVNTALRRADQVLAKIALAYIGDELDWRKELPIGHCAALADVAISGAAPDLAMLGMGTPETVKTDVHPDTVLQDLIDEALAAAGILHRR